MFSLRLFSSLVRFLGLRRNTRDRRQQLAELRRVADEEVLARFVLFRRWLTKDNTVKGDAFMPPKDLQLSVTRHDGLSPEQLWQRGQVVAVLRRTKLLGRADLTAKSVRTSASGFHVLPAPLEDNAQHAHIVGWPANDKDEQMQIALQLAQAAQFVRVEPPSAK